MATQVASHRCCPACGGNGGGSLVANIALRTPDGHPLGSGYQVASCSACGCGFANVPEQTPYYEQYYASLAKYANEALTERLSKKSGRPDSDLEPVWVSEKAASSARRIRDLVPRIDSRVLDIGCSTGSLLAALGRLGYRELHGVDPSAESVYQANARAGINAEVGTFSSIPVGIGTFDLICATGVFEHLWDVGAAVRSLLPLLRADGVIYVEVPDARRYLDPYVSPYEDFSTEHINHFSATCLRWLASRFGLKTISEISYEAPLTEEVLTGCVAVAWTRASSLKIPEQRDNDLEKQLIAFSEKSIHDLALVSEGLELALSASSGYILWGIGEAALKLLALPVLNSREAVLYVDGNPSRWGFRFGGAPVVTPSSISSGRTPIIAGSFIRADSIVEAASQLGLHNPIVRLDL
ncbi:MAG: class I SAM-dependent methyltransferase [Acidimicrobiaceae bacterium]|nr:class I SAM-dependent methyltransferase [Acidimicrobiaceae bacterium]